MQPTTKPALTVHKYTLGPGVQLEVRLWMRVLPDGSTRTRRIDIFGTGQPMLDDDAYTAPIGGAHEPHQ